MDDKRGSGRPGGRSRGAEAGQGLARKGLPARDLPFRRGSPGRADVGAAAIQSQPDGIPGRCGGTRRRKPPQTSKPRKSRQQDVGR